MKFQMTCACGDKTMIESTDIAAARAELKKRWTQNAIDAHMQDKHMGQPEVAVEQCHAMIDKSLVSVARQEHV